MLLLVLFFKPTNSRHCMAQDISALFIDGAENRTRMLETGFSWSPERLCTLLSLLVKKGVLKKKINSIHVLPDGIRGKRRGKMLPK